MINRRNLFKNLVAFLVLPDLNIKPRKYFHLLNAIYKETNEKTVLIVSSLHKDPEYVLCETKNKYFKFNILSYQRQLGN